MIFVTGDTHGTLDLKKLNNKNFKEGRNLTKNDYVIITGDFGFPWYGNNEDKFWIDWFEKKPFTTLFVDGNHENFDLLNNYKVELWNGGKVHKLNNSLIHLMRGQTFNIDEKIIFTFGGAKSEDKIHRKEHKSWWSEEMPSSVEYHEGLENLRTVGNKVDYIITHTCSAKTQSILKDRYGKHKEITEINRYFNFIEETVYYKKWYFGHNHLDEDISDKETIVYQRVILI